MDDIICGLCRVVCITEETNYKSYFVTISNGVNSWTQQMSNGVCVFDKIPSLPAPAKKPFTATLKATATGSAVFTENFELGFGDSTVLLLGNSKGISEKDAIKLGDGLSLARSVSNGNTIVKLDHASGFSGTIGSKSDETVYSNGGTWANFYVPYVNVTNGHVTSSGTRKITVTHPNSGVTAASYGASSGATLSHGGSFSVPYITVDSQGHVTYANTKNFNLPPLSTTTSVSSGNNSLITSGGVYGALKASTLKDALATSSVKVEITNINQKVGGVGKDVSIGKTGYAPLGVVGIDQVASTPDGVIWDTRGDAVASAYIFGDSTLSTQFLISSNSYIKGVSVNVKILWIKTS